MFGTVKVADVLDQEFTVAAVPFTFTLPRELPKPSPAMVICMPGWPTVGPMLPTSGAVAALLICQTLTECAGSERLFAGLLPPLPLVTVSETPLCRRPR